MSRIQNILEKAEREGAAMRTSRMVPFDPAVSVPPPPASRRNSIEDLTASVPAAAVIAPAAAVTGLGVAPIDEGVASHTAILNPLLIAALAPQSLAAEQYRSLRTRLAQMEGSGGLRTVLITSPQKGDGKSVTASNLALTVAQELQRRVVIVEADLRKPSLQHMFGLPPGPGLSEYLTGAVELKDAMQFVPEHNLTLMTAGAAPLNPAELLGSTAMRRLLDHLRTRFDRVILDTPPVLPLADVAILAPMVDGSLLVVRAGVTPKPAIENALRAFDASRLLGVVLNEAGIEQDYRYEAVSN